MKNKKQKELEIHLLGEEFYCMESSVGSQSLNQRLDNEDDVFHRAGGGLGNCPEGEASGQRLALNVPSPTRAALTFAGPGSRAQMEATQYLSK